MSLDPKPSSFWSFPSRVRPPPTNPIVRDLARALREDSSRAIPATTIKRDARLTGGRPSYYGGVMLSAWFRLVVGEPEWSQWGDEGLKEVELFLDGALVAHRTVRNDGWGITLPYTWWKKGETHVAFLKLTDHVTGEVWYSNTMRQAM